MVLSAKNLDELSNEINTWLQLSKSMYSIKLTIDQSDDKPFKAIINELDDFYPVAQMETITDLRSFYNLTVQGFCDKIGINEKGYYNILQGRLGDDGIRQHSMNISRVFEIDWQIIRDLIVEDILRRC